MIAIFFQAKYQTKKTQAGSVEAVRQLDELLLQLVVSRLPNYLILLIVRLALIVIIQIIVEMVLK